MKKTLLFVINGFHIGGVNKAFISFAQKLDFSRFEVYVFPTDDNEIWRMNLPPQIGVVSRCSASNPEDRFFPIKKQLYRVGVWCAKNAVEADYWAVKTWNIPNRTYDYVICYNGQDMAAITLASRIPARHRVIWFHGEISDLGKRYLDLCNRIMRKYTCAISVSNALKENVLSAFPQFKDRLFVVHNTVDAQRIKQLSKEPLDYPLKRNSIVTVGRLCHEKGQDLIPLTVRKLLDAGYQVYWYIVGDGGTKEKLLAAINDNGVGDNVFLLGSKENPFPYINECDIYVQPSRTEGWGLTVQEARILCKPIVVTRIPVMAEQIVNGKNGLISEDCSPEALFHSIKTMLDSLDLRRKFIASLQDEESVHKEYANEFYLVLNEEKA